MKTKAITEKKSTGSRERSTDVPKQKEIVLVDLGKTSGSSITCMMRPPIHKSSNGGSQCKKNDKIMGNNFSALVIA